MTSRSLFVLNPVRATSPFEIAARSGHSEGIASVHNFGSAIQIEARERIFDRFYCAPQMKDCIPGTGIGLFAVRELAEAHHWLCLGNQRRQRRNHIFLFPADKVKKETLSSEASTAAEATVAD
jgi:signal transduction histidine kinase